MSKDGPPIARWGLGIMTDTVMLFNPNIKAYYNRVKQRTRRGSYAHVLTMKKLARMIHHMMITEQNYKWENEALTEEKISRLGNDADAAGGES